MDKSYSDYFGRMLMESVRDKTILGFNRVVSKRVPGITGEKYQRIMESFTEEQLCIIQDNVIPDVVDKCLFEFLRFIDTSQDIDIVVKSKVGEKKLSEINDNIASLLNDSDGWKNLYSKVK